MAEAGIFYINKEVHTGELLEAGLELADYAARTAEWAYLRAGEINTTLSPTPQPNLLREAVTPYELPRPLSRGWKGSERRATKLLIASGALDYPLRLDKTRRQLIEHNEDLPTDDYRVSAQAFFEDSWKRFNVLGNEGLRAQLGSLTRLSLAYGESHLLRTAVYAGVYLTRGN